MPTERCRLRAWGFVFRLTDILVRSHLIFPCIAHPSASVTENKIKNPETSWWQRRDVNPAI